MLKPLCCAWRMTQQGAGPWSVNSPACDKGPVCTLNGEALDGGNRALLQPLHSSWSWERYGQPMEVHVAQLRLPPWLCVELSC